MALLQHNIKTYEECLKYFISGGKDLLLVQDTGTGKSYICMELLQTLFKGKSVLYVVPMWKIAENFKNVGGFDSIKHNVDFVTYNYFLQEENVSGLDKYDVLVFDEAHHIGSEKSGGVIQDIISNNKEKFIIGMTATPKREDALSVEVYFNRVIYGVTVFNCIEDGLMPKFAYILCNDSIIKDINIHRNLYNTNSIVYHGKRYNLNINYKNSKELLKGIVSQHHKDKWICYFGSIAELKQNKDTIKEVFKGYKIVELHSNSKDLDLQKLETENNVVILSVDMFLEGIHLKGVKGIVISRNVGSITVFRQILGRVSSIGDMEVPIVVDCTNTLNRILLKVNRVQRGTNTDSGYNRGSYNPASIIDVNLVDKEYRDISDLLFNLQNIRKAKTIGGYTFTSDIDLSNQLGRGDSYVSFYKNQKGFSYEDIIQIASERPIRKRPDKYKKEVMGFSFINDVDLSRQLGKHSGYVSYLRKRGLSYEEIIQKAASKKEVMGYSFVSDSDLSRQLGKSTGYVSYLRKKGLSHEEIIQKVLSTPQKEIKQVLGFRFKSNRDLSLQLCKSVSFVAGCRKRGLSYEEIIQKVKGKEVLGYSFTSDRDLSRQLGKPPYYVMQNKQSGLSYEEIIQKTCKKEVMGYSFVSDVDLSRQLGMNDRYVETLKGRGFSSYEDIISKAEKSKKTSAVKEVSGYKFKSDSDLSEQLGKCKDYVGTNRRKGLSYEEIIKRAEEGKSKCTKS